MHWILFLVLGSLAAFAWVRWEKRQRIRKMEAAFAGRAPLSPADFYERFFSAQGVPREVVSGVRQVLEEQLGADLSRLAASDDFSENIGFFFEFDSMVDVEIVCALEEEFSIRISDEEATNAHTIRDIVELVSRKVQAGFRRDVERELSR
jgi:acyl carrier protein